MSASLCRQLEFDFFPKNKTTGVGWKMDKGYLVSTEIKMKVYFLEVIFIASKFIFK
jgi:hypothetical protein